MVVSNTYSVVLFVLFVVVLSCVWLCATHIVLCYLSCLSSSVSCVWLCPTHIVLCYLFCLSSSVSCVWLCPTHIVLHNHTQDTGRRQTRQITQHYICWTQPYTRHTRRQTRQITQHYICWTQPYTRPDYLYTLPEDVHSRFLMGFLLLIVLDFCVVFFALVSLSCVLCTLYCEFLWIVHS
jgi:hypothetical protein